MLGPSSKGESIAMASTSFNMTDASVDEVKEYLLQRGICEEVAASFATNQVTGLAFLRLTESDIKELVPNIGIRTSIRAILRDHTEVSISDCMTASSSLTLTSESNISVEKVRSS